MPAPHAIGVSPLKRGAPPTPTPAHAEQHTDIAPLPARRYLMDPICYGFEQYVGLGLWRDQYDRFPRHASGTLAGVKEGDVAFDGVTQLSTYLAASDDVKQCFARYLAYYAYGRSAWPQDSCTYDAIRSGSGT